MEKTELSLLFSAARPGKYGSDGQEVRVEAKESTTRKKCSSGGKPNPKKKGLEAHKKAKTMPEKSQQSTVTKGYADSREMKKKRKVAKTSQLPAKKQRFPTILELKKDGGGSEMLQQPTEDKPTAVESEVKTPKVARKPKIIIAESSTAKKRKADTSEMKKKRKVAKTSQLPAEKPRCQTILEGKKDGGSSEMLQQPTEDKPTAVESEVKTTKVARKPKIIMAEKEPSTAKKRKADTREIKTTDGKTPVMHSETTTIKKKRKKQKYSKTYHTAVQENFERTLFQPVCEGNMPHITQIGAYDLISGTTFSKYVKPKKPISTEAQQLTRIVMDDSNGMIVRGRSVCASDIHEAFDSFLTWIGRFRNVVLISNYGNGFDFPILREAAKNIGKAKELSDSVCGFIDSLLIFRKQYPGRNSYKQRDLVKEILKKSYSTYNAKSSAKVLGKLIRHTELSSRELHAYIRKTY